MPVSDLGERLFVSLMKQRNLERFAVRALLKANELWDLSSSDSLTTPSSDPIRGSQAQLPPKSTSGRIPFPVTPSHRLADAPASASPISKSRSTILIPSKGSLS